MTSTLALTTPAIKLLAERFIAAEHRPGQVDHLLILADALDELSREQHLSGLTQSCKEPAALAARLRETATARAAGTGKSEDSP